MVRPPSESPLAGHGRELCLQGVSGQACFQTRAPASAVTLVSVASGARWDLGAVSRVAEHVGKVEVGSGKAGGGGEGGFLFSPDFTLSILCRGVASEQCRGSFR